ncbi:hypothetical protein GCM10009733_098720 [Nonomuraea maheshkhaliensis]|uniref:HTH IS21-type domain-containing protein n=1 Tax=Nonomuraea maheshkhaliensis TaxID=419590 RepID=A0ABP4TDD1_9ACTN
MILDQESWMNLRRFRGLHQAGATYKEIAEATGLDWRTVKKYLQQDAPAAPPKASSRKGTQPQVIEPYVHVIDAMLRAERAITASTIHERLAAEYGFAHSYQRVKLYVAQARPRIAAEHDGDAEGAGRERLRGLHRRFEVTPGAQAQVDWGEEGPLLSGPGAGAGKVYSFHMTLSYSRDPFCLFTARTDLVTFFECAPADNYIRPGRGPASALCGVREPRSLGRGECVRQDDRLCSFAWPI